VEKKQNKDNTAFKVI